MQQVRIKPKNLQNVKQVFIVFFQKFELEDYSQNLDQTIDCDLNRHQFSYTSFKKPYSDIFPWAEQQFEYIDPQIYSCSFQKSNYQLKQLLVKISKMGFAPQYVENLLTINGLVIDKCDKQTINNVIDLILSQNSFLMKYNFFFFYLFLSKIVDFPLLEQIESQKHMNKNRKILTRNKLNITNKEVKQSSNHKIQIFIQSEQLSSLDQTQAYPAQDLLADDEKIVVEENKIDCRICIGPFQSLTFCFEACNHQFCRTCIDDYLTNCIKCGQVMEIKCPFDGCLSVFSENQIKQICTPEIMNKYYRFRTYKEIESNQNARWCPKIGCIEYMIGNQNSEKLICKCGQEMCFKCGNEYHPNKNCEEALDENYQEARIKFKIKPCPKCKAPIQKASGCNHMSCYKCSFNFCWICNARFNKFHYHEYNPFGCSCNLFFYQYIKACSGQYDSDEPCMSPITIKILYFFPRVLLLLFILPFCALKILVKAGVDSCCFFYLKWKETQCYDKFKKEYYGDCWCFFKIIGKFICYTVSFALCPIIFIFYQIPKKVMKSLEQCC